MQKHCLSLRKKPNSFAKKKSEKDSKSVDVLSVQFVLIAAQSDIGFISPLPWYSCLFLYIKKEKKKRKKLLYKLTYLQKEAAHHRTMTNRNPLCTTLPVLLPNHMKAGASFWCSNGPLCYTNKVFIFVLFICHFILFFFQNAII